MKKFAIFFIACLTFAQTAFAVVSSNLNTSLLEYQAITSAIIDGFSDVIGQNESILEIKRETKKVSIVEPILVKYEIKTFISRQQFDPVIPAVNLDVQQKGTRGKKHQKIRVYTAEVLVTPNTGLSVEPPIVSIAKIQCVKHCKKEVNVRSKTKTKAGNLLEANEFDEIEYLENF